MILNDKRRIKEYLPISGDPEFIELTRKFWYVFSNLYILICELT